MKRILVLGAGGTPSTNFVRSLREAPDDYYILGADADPYRLQRAETDEKEIACRAGSPLFQYWLRNIVKSYDIDFVHAQNDTEVAALSDLRFDIPCRTFLPPRRVVDTCQDKLSTYEVWRENLKVPHTRLMRTPVDLSNALDDFGVVWVRATSGAGGRGSLLVDDLKTGMKWVDINDGWGSYTCSEYLGKRSVTWMSLWHKGQLVSAQTRERVSWELSRISPSGVTGVTGVAKTTSDPAVDDVALKSILTIDGYPHGLYGVDMTYDSDGVPNPTEINIGRFFTTIHFFTKLGLNMPSQFVRLAFGEEPPRSVKTVNPCRDNMYWIRGVDFEPLLLDEKEIGWTSY